MRAIVIVIRDLYLESGESPDATVPGIEQLARFGDETALPEGWRAWTARWLGLPQYAAAAPASIAAAALADAPADRAVWLATPVHLIAGLTSLHFDRRSVLRLQEAELRQLAASFAATFRDSGFELRPLAGGELLLSGPQVPAPASTTEPARMVLTSVAESLPMGEGARALRRLSAEIEMWLHGHPVNDQLTRRGALTVATLWLWGGGDPSAAHAVATPEAIKDAAFGADAYVRGLWRLAGGETRPMPVDWAAVIGEPRAERALVVVEVAELLQANASWSLADAMAEIDHRLISPSVAALRRGELERLILLANDRCLSLRAADHWRLWRRMRGRKGLEALA
ncbi:MAG: hypothetical protein ACREVO_04925 [Steroidobacteraceae bacterium]